MKYRFLQVTPLFLCLLGLLFWYVALSCTEAVSCTFGGYLEGIFLPFIKPLYVYVINALAPALIAIFIRREVFNTWLKFTAVWVVVVILILANTPVYPEGGGYINMYTVTRSEWAAFYGKAFSVLSIIIIAWKYWRIRKQERGS